MLKNVSEIRKNNEWNVFEPNQIYESYRVVEEYMIFLWPNYLIMYTARTLSKNDKYY